MQTFYEFHEKFVILQKKVGNLWFVLRPHNKTVLYNIQPHLSKLVSWDNKTCIMLLRNIDQIVLDSGC